MVGSIIAFTLVGLLVGFVLWLDNKCEALKEYHIAPTRGEVPKSIGLGIAQIESKCYRGTLRVAATPEHVYLINTGPFFSYPKKTFRIPRSSFTRLDKDREYDYGIKAKGRIIRCIFDRAIWEKLPELASY